VLNFLSIVETANSENNSDTVANDDLYFKHFQNPNLSVNYLLNSYSSSKPSQQAPAQELIDETDFLTLASSDQKPNKDIFCAGLILILTSLIVPTVAVSAPLETSPVYIFSNDNNQAISIGNSINSKVVTSKTSNIQSEDQYFNVIPIENNKVILQKANTTQVLSSKSASVGSELESTLYDSKVKNELQEWLLVPAIKQGSFKIVLANKPNLVIKFANQNKNFVLAENTDNNSDKLFTPELVVPIQVNPIIKKENSNLPNNPTDVNALNNQWPVINGPCYISQMPGGRTSHSKKAAFDFGAYRGNPTAVAVNPGIVILSAWTSGGGKTVKILTPEGKINIYYHLKTLSVYKGQQILGGEKIGIVGTTGHSTGNHLHVQFLNQDGKQDWSKSTEMRTKFGWQKGKKCAE
jgi:murein DD-endopeptidase MepM/ murein hydrolase activator NlpD